MVTIVIGFILVLESGRIVMTGRSKALETREYAPRKPDYSYYGPSAMRDITTLVRTVSTYFPISEAYILLQILVDLNLGHAGSPTRASTATQVDTSRTAGEDREDQRGGESSPHEPQESRRRLRLATPLLGVARAVGDRVGQSVSLFIPRRVSRGTKRPER